MDYCRITIKSYHISNENERNIEKDIYLIRVQKNRDNQLIIPVQSYLIIYQYDN